MTSYCILVADHDKASSDLVRSTLAADGYNTNIAASSRDAITSAAITQPQLLLINPALLQPSGIEAAKQIHLSTHCKVLFLSPTADEPFFRAVLAGLQQQGCESSALRVPFTAEELLCPGQDSSRDPLLSPTAEPSAGFRAARIFGEACSFRCSPFG